MHTGNMSDAMRNELCVHFISANSKHLLHAALESLQSGRDLAKISWGILKCRLRAGLSGQRRVPPRPALPGRLLVSGSKPKLV